MSDRPVRRYCGGHGCTLVAALAIALTASCERSDAVPEDSPPAAANTAPGETALWAERRAWTDPAHLDIRDGTRIDEERLLRGLVGLMTRHSPAHALVYEQTVAALPNGPMPAAPKWRRLATFSPPDEPAMRDVEATSWLFDDGIRQTVERALSTYLVLMMSEQVGLSARELGVWMGYLRAAEPTFTRCDGDGEAEAELTVCVDYGPDVFAVTLRRHKAAWIARGLSWWQASSR